MKAIVLVSVITVAVLTSVNGNAAEPAHEPDKRATINANAEAREHVLLEMRQLLEAVQGITDGLAKNDMNKVAASAEAVGMKAMRATPQEIASQLPMEFKAMGRSVHEAMDVMARDARDLGSKDHTIEQLNNVLGTCVACHATFKFR